MKGKIVDDFVSGENGVGLWVMDEDDPYTKIVRDWNLVKRKMERVRKQVAAELFHWQEKHMTNDDWKPTRIYSFDPDSGIRTSVNGDCYTSDSVALSEYLWYKLTGKQTKLFHTSVIGSFSINVTLKKVEGNKIVLDVWMYNGMTRESLGAFTDYKKFPSNMRSQYMWFNWEEEFDMRDYDINTLDSQRKYGYSCVTDTDCDLWDL